MQGSTVAQFLWQWYSQTLLQTVLAVTNTILADVTPIAQVALGLYVIISGKQLLFNATSLDQQATRVIRAIMVMFLLMPANFNVYITTAVTQTIPNEIAQAVNGQPNLAGAQGFDALINATQNFAAQVRAQASGLFYMSERITVYLVEGLCIFLIGCCLLIWTLAQSTIAFIVPLGALILPLYLFDATRQFVMAWVGKLVSLFLVLAVTLILSAVVVKGDAAYLQQYGQTVASNATNPQFQMNAGDMSFTAFGPPAQMQASVNVDAAIDTLLHIATVFGFGLFMLALMVPIALGIGGSGGFSAAPVFNVVSSAAKAGARRLTR